jgi:hypothetical protein
MSDPVYLDARLSAAVDALWLATLENAPGLFGATTRTAALANISALWAAFDDADRAAVHRFVRHWNDERAEFVFELVRTQPNISAAIDALTQDDRNRVIAHVLFDGHPPAVWTHDEMFGPSDRP